MCNSFFNRLNCSPTPQWSLLSLSNYVSDQDVRQSAQNVISICFIDERPRWYQNGQKSKLRRFPKMNAPVSSLTFAWKSTMLWRIFLVETGNIHLHQPFYFRNNHYLLKQWFPFVSRCIGTNKKTPDEMLIASTSARFLSFIVFVSFVGLVESKYTRWEQLHANEYLPWLTAWFNFSSSFRLLADSDGHVEMVEEFFSFSVSFSKIRSHSCVSSTPHPISF